MNKTNIEKYVSEIGAVKASETFEQKTAQRLKEQPQGKPEPLKRHRALKFALAPALAAVLLCALLFSNVFSPVNTVKASENLMEGITPDQVKAAAAPDEKFIGAAADFSVSLFRKTIKKDANTLVSPFSVSLALGMTANGAANNTLRQFQNVLGGGMELNELNWNYHSMASRLASGSGAKLQVGNSIWYANQGLEVKKDFLQRNADYYGAGAYQMDFSKQETATRVNGWVKEHTGGKIDRIIDSIDPDTVMYLINALYFEDEWQHPYGKSSSAVFHAADDTVPALFMKSTEQYIHDENSEGMIKPFKDSRYAFAAILPKEGVGLETYVNQMTGTAFLSLIRSADGTAECSLPKFKYEYKADLNEPLKAMGLTDGFDSGRADFSSMATAPLGKLIIGDVLHKTFIEVDEIGAKAGAVTEVQMELTAMPLEVKTIDFNRPFVYAIIDTQTNLPIFLGTVSNPAK